MPIAPTVSIHPTAVVDPSADLAEGVQVGPYAIIEGPVQIGPNCTIRARAHLIGPMTLGPENDIGINVVLGERPQHLSFDTNIVTRTEIGEHNTFREGVTVHRGSHSTGVTIIGNHNYLMVNSHVGHDCRMGNNNILANGALMAGHVEIVDRVFISGNATIHQFVRMGRLSFLSGNSSSTKDLLPFVMMAERDCVVGLNKIGMRRAGMSSEDIQVAKQAFRILFRTNLLQKLAVAQLEKELGHHPVGREFLDFIRSSKRGFISRNIGEDEAISEAA